MSTNAIEGKSGQLAEVDEANRLLTASRSAIIDGETPDQAAVVNSAGSLQVALRSTAALAAVTNVVHVADGPSVTVVASDREGRRSILLQPRGAAIIVRFEDADPDDDDLRIEDGEKFSLPFAYEGEVRAMGDGDDAEVVVVEGVEP